MALQPQYLRLAFNQGLDTKTDPKQVLPGKLLTLQNGIFISPQKIKKRNGYQALSQVIDGVGSVTVGSALATYKNEIDLFTGSELYSYSESTSKWTDKGTASSIEVTGHPVIRNSYQQTTCDSAFHPAGIEVYAWEDSRGGSRYSIIDSQTGQYLAQDLVILSTAATPKPMIAGNYVIILYYDTSGHHIKGLPIMALNPLTPGSAFDVATNVNTSHPLFDACTFNNSIYVAYNTSDGGGGVEVKYIDQTATVSAGKDITGKAASACININVDRTLSQMWVSFYNGTSVYAFILSSDLTTTVLANTIVETLANVVNVVSLPSNGTATLLYEVSAGSTYNELIRTNTLTKAGSAGTAADFLRSVGLYSKIFSYGGVNYVTVTYSSPLQPTYFVVNLLGKVCAKIAPSLGGGLTSKATLHEVTQVTSGQFISSHLIKDLLTTQTGQVYTQTGVQSVTYSFVSANTFQRVELGDDLHITGGYLSMYDGVSVVEHGFHLYPEPLSCVTASGSGSIAAGTYLYTATYEWTDNQGNIHRSGTAVPVSQVTTTASSTNTITIPTLRLTSKIAPRTPVRICVYRTQTVGTIYYMVTSVSAPTLNDTTVDTVTVTDTISDATLVGNTLLYTTGGVLDNIALPACSVACSYKQRIIAVPSEDKQSYWYSKQVVPGSPVEWSDLFVEQIDARGGDITSLAWLDDKLVIFKETEIYYQAFEGPDSTGAQNDIPDAQLVTTDGGAIDPNSVVLMPLGLMYKSDKGIYLLDRSLQVRYIGDAVEAYNSYSVQSATLVSNTNQVRFCISNQTALVFDYYFSQWSVFTNHNAVDSVIFNGEFCYLQPTGAVFQESPGQFTDNGNFIQLGIVLGWLSLAGMQGFQRVRRVLVLGDYISPHQLQVSAAYDFNSNATQTDIVNAATLLGSPAYGGDAVWGSETSWGGAYPLYEFKMHLQQQKCTAIQLSFYDIQSSNYGEGLSLSGIALEFGVKEGLNKLGATRSVG